LAHDSADVWAHPDIFHLGSDDAPRFQAGCRPLLQRHRPSSGATRSPLDALARTGCVVDRPDARDLRLRGRRAARPLPRLQAYWEVPGGRAAVDGAVKARGALF
jgi:hypothetical protein